MSLLGLLTRQVWLVAHRNMVTQRQLHWKHGKSPPSTWVTSHNNCIPRAPCTTYRQLDQPDSLLSPAILTANITLKRELVNLFSFRDFLRPMSFIYFLNLKPPQLQDEMVQLRGNGYTAIHFTQIKSPFLSTLFSIVLNSEVPPYFSEQRTNTRNGSTGMGCKVNQTHSHWVKETWMDAMELPPSLGGLWGHSSLHGCHISSWGTHCTTVTIGNAYGTSVSRISEVRFHILYLLSVCALSFSRTNHNVCSLLSTCMYSTCFSSVLGLSGFHTDCHSLRGQYG